MKPKPFRSLIRVARAVGGSSNGMLRWQCGLDCGHTVEVIQKSKPVCRTVVCPYEHAPTPEAADKGKTGRWE